MKTGWKSTVSPWLAAVALACLGVGLWFVAAAMDANHAVKEAQLPWLLGFLALLAAVGAAAFAPVFHVVVRRIFVGIVVFVSTWLLCFVALNEATMNILDHYRMVWEETPMWIRFCIIAAPLVTALVAAVHLSIRCTQPRPAHTNR